MHRLATLAGSAGPDDGSWTFVEQEAADLVLLSSADTDLAAVAALLEAVGPCVPSISRFSAIPP